MTEQVEASGPPSQAQLPQRNPDALLFVGGRESGADAPHYSAARDGSPGSAHPRAVGSLAAPEPEPFTAAECATWSGEKVYDEVCDRCHKMWVDGAPVVGDQAVWKPRIAKGRQTLLHHIYDDFNKMPARGECDFCSDSQLAAALDFMLQQSR